MGYGTDGLTFNTLRKANIKRLPLFKDAKGRRAHSKADGSDWSPAQWLQAVVGELGEYANLRKKVERGDMTLAEALPELRKELADVVVYLDLLAYQMRIDLGEAVMDKWNETSIKVGANLYIDAEDWHYLKSPMSAQSTSGSMSTGGVFPLEDDADILVPSRLPRRSMNPGPQRSDLAKQMQSGLTRRRRKGKCK